MESEKLSDIVIVVSRSLDIMSCRVACVQLAMMTWTTHGTTQGLSVNANTLPTTCCLPVGLIKLPSSQFIGYC